MGTTLLLADDSITIQKVVGIIFANEVANEDYRLFIVDNGSVVLEKAREVNPDVLLVDALMPGKSGYEVCEEIRRDSVLKDTPILLLVGAFEPFDEDKAKSSGADDYITKPFESQGLIDKVKSLITLSRDRAPSAGSFAGEAVADMQPVQMEAVQPKVEHTANLAEQFQGYIRLGSEHAQPAAPVQAEAAVATFEPVVADDLKAEEPEGVILLSSVDVYEAGPDDDPWGTFTEEVTEGEPIQFGEVIEDAAHPDESDTIEVMETFTFIEEPPTAAEPAEISVETLTVNDASLTVQEGDNAAAELPAKTGIAGFTSDVRPLEPLQGGTISLGEEDVAPCASTVFTPEMSDDVQAGSLETEPGSRENIGFHFAPEDTLTSSDEPFEVSPEASSATEAPSLGERSEEQELPQPFGMPQDESSFEFAPDTTFVPAAMAASMTAEAQETVLPVPVTESVVSLTEEQLAAAIARVSREVIEKIAWDVVPDLAETIIKEEIRKIKEGLKK